MMEPVISQTELTEAEAHQYADHQAHQQIFSLRAAVTTAEAKATDAQRVLNEALAELNSAKNELEEALKFQAQNLNKRILQQKR
jgi:hypothetical protein